MTYNNTSINGCENKIQQISLHLDAMDKDDLYRAQIVGAHAKPINLDRGALEILNKYFSGEEIIFNNTTPKPEKREESESHPFVNIALFQDWIKQFKTEGRDLDAEVKEIESDIANNKLWLAGATDFDEEFAFESNIGTLNLYLRWLKFEQIKRELFMVGNSAIESLLCRTVDNNLLSKDEIENLLNQVYWDLPDYEFDAFYERYVLKVG